MKQLILIRKALPIEKPKITEILQSTGLSSKSNSCVENTMVVETNDSIVGCGSLDLRDRVAFLKYIAILPRYQGQGLGDGLVRALINYLDRRSVEKLFILNEKPLNYFERFGFRYIPSNEFDKMFKDIETAPFIMKLDINEFFKNHHCHH